MREFDDTGQRRRRRLLSRRRTLLVNVGLVLAVVASQADVVGGIILSGTHDSYARFPKWAHSFENSLSLELKTRQADGLLLYTDDGNVNGNFYALSIVDGKIQLDFRLGDNSNDFGPRRAVNTIRIEEVRVDDDKWHALTIFQSWENVKLELDYTLVFKILNQRSFVFGNILKNSDVFVGGVPPDVHVLPLMSSPLRRHTQHLAVNVRNLVYRQYPQGVTSPQLIDAHGARNNEDDQCRSTGVSSREKFECLNDGVCLSTNDGPKCDCSLSDFEGKLCDVEKADAELTFGGDEWVGYDVSYNVSGAMRVKRENLTLSFKTVHGNAMLFFAGDEKSFVHLALKDGALLATSKFDGTDPRMIRMFNSFPSERYDDDAWHDVVLERSLQMHSEKMSAVHVTNLQMTLNVDGRKDEIRQYAPELDWITNSFAYLGALPKENPQRDVSRVSFRGCMKKVKFDVDATRMLFVHLADQGYGGSVIRTGGELAYSCKDPSQPADVLSFNSGDDFISLPKWDSLSSGSLSFHFRSSMADGLIVYHGVLQNNASDYMAFELIDGHLFFVINLGSGVVRLQTTAKKVADDQWHHVHLERVSRAGSVVVDATKIDFNTPGVSSNLIVDDPIFVGGVPNASFAFPSSVWSIGLRRGFVGCLKNVRFNGISAKIANVYEQTNVTGISLGCPLATTVDLCEPNPCENFGKCEASLGAFRCDCTTTNMDGPTCNIEPIAVQMEGEEVEGLNVFVLPTTTTSEAEHLHVRFKTEHARGGVLFDTLCNSNADQMSVFLNDSHLNLFIRDSASNNTFSWGKSLADNQWHYLQVRRLGQRLLLFLDGFWGHSVFLQSALKIEMDELGAGYSVHPSAPPPRDQQFRGFISKLVFNGVDLLAKHRKSVSFTNTTGYLTFASQKISVLTGAFRVQFKFQTLVRSGLLVATLPQSDDEQSFRIEIYNGRIKYTYHAGGQDLYASSPKLANRQHLSDMRWHNVLLYQDSRSGDHLLLIDNTTTVLATKTTKSVVAHVVGTLVVGGVPETSRGGRAAGFRGCFSSLRVNDKTFDLLGDADQQLFVVKGCSGPIARCSPQACANDGRCIQQWNSVRCECSLTAHSGPRCQNPATTVRFDGEPAALFYEFPSGERPTSSRDFVVFAFRTTQPSGVLFAVECAVDQDFFTIFLLKGFLHVRFNLGSRDHQFGFFTKTLNDGDQHVVKMFRTEANITLQVDKMPSLRYRPKSDSDLVLLNMQARLVVGASFNTRHFDVATNHRFRRRKKALLLYDSYQGEIVGVNFNGILLLDLYEHGSERVHTVGDVQTTTVAEATSGGHVDDDDDVLMADFYHENPGEALIESIVPSCLSVEEHQNCYAVQTDDSTDSAHLWMASTTALPIMCLMDWRSPACRSAAPPPPRFASNFVLAPNRRKNVVNKDSRASTSVDGDDDVSVDAGGDDVETASSADGFFSPVLPTASAAATTRNDVAVSSSANSASAGRWSSSPSSHTKQQHQQQQHHPRPTTTTTTTRATTRTTTTSTTTTTTTPQPVRATTTTKKMSENVIFLSELAAEVEGSASDDSYYEGSSRQLQVQATMATKPMTTTSTAMATSTVVTVLPRPYQSVKEAAEQNPDYLGSSIWSSVDQLPEPMVTGPAWRKAHHHHQHEQHHRRGNATTPSMAFPSAEQDVDEESATTTPMTTSPPTTATTTTTTSTMRMTTTSTAKQPTIRRTESTIGADELGSTTLAATVRPRQKPSPSYTVYAVRPTTPMGSPLTSTMQVQTETTTDFPRTPLIMGSSLTVILAIAAVVFFVFKCRQTPPSSEHYPMTINAKSQSGYTAITSDQLSPPLNDRTDCTQPLISRPNLNGNGYQPLNGSVIPNGHPPNGHGGLNGGMRSATMPRNGGTAAKKKDFKEWYV